jgi:hypothetical protein
MFHLKRNPNYYTWIPSHTKQNQCNIEFLPPCPIVAADALLEIGTAVISDALSPDEHLSQTNISCVLKCYQSVYCCLIRCLFVTIRTAKCFANSSKRFRCEVMFENEHTFCSWIHHVRTCTALACLLLGCILNGTARISDEVRDFIVSVLVYFSFLSSFEMLASCISVFSLGKPIYKTRNAEIRAHTTGPPGV